MSCLVDYHCHLDLYPDFENLIDECEKNQIYTLAVTTTPKAFPRNYSLMSNKKYVRAALGLHPQLVASRASEIEIWKEYFTQTRYIGEIGLDAGTQFYKSFELQKEIFKTILEFCSRAGNKILSIHSVRSVKIVLDMIEKYSTHKTNGIVLHWFSGEAPHLQKAIELGCYFSINSQMLKNTKSQSLIKQIPINRLLTETDGPFSLTGTTTSRPINSKETIILLADLLKRNYDNTSEAIFSNMQHLETK